MKQDPQQQKPRCKNCGKEADYLEPIKTAFGTLQVCEACEEETQRAAVDYIRDNEWQLGLDGDHGSGIAY